VLQEFPDGDVSIQVDVLIETTDQARVVISLFNKKAEEFISGADVRLHRMSEPGLDMVTDSSGRASFSVPIPSGYSVDIIEKGKRISQIHLVFQD
jgi:hypothetical protein